MQDYSHDSASLPLMHNRQIQVSVSIILINEFCLNTCISCWAFNLPSWRQHSVGSHLGVTFASARCASYYCKKVGHLNARAFSGFSKFTFGDRNWLFISRSVNKSVCLSISWFFIMFYIVIVFCIAVDCGYVPCLSIFRLEYGYARVDMRNFVCRYKILKWMKFLKDGNFMIRKCETNT